MNISIPHRYQMPLFQAVARAIERGSIDINEHTHIHLGVVVPAGCLPESLAWRLAIYKAFKQKLAEIDSLNPRHECRCCGGKGWVNG